VHESVKETIKDEDQMIKDEGPETGGTRGRRFQ